MVFGEWSALFSTNGGFLATSLEKKSVKFADFRQKIPIFENLKT